MQSSSEATLLETATSPKLAIKEFKFVKPKSLESIEVEIYEALDPKYGMYVWPCAPVLAQFLLHNEEAISGKSILELGAGTALPSIIAAKCGAALIQVTDSDLLPSCLCLTQKNLAANGLASEVVQTFGLTWGVYSPRLINLKPVDFILASDCFYDPKNFEDILATVAFILKRNPSAKFWSTYQERSADWSIEHLLEAWRLQCLHIPIATFEGDDPLLGGATIPSRHTIHMLQITLQDEQKA